jgi:branched-chain amino acid transport system substrate-binding protein
MKTTSHPPESGKLSARRRNVLKGAGAAAAASLLPASFARAASGDTLKIGFVSPQSGPLAVFAQSDQFVMDQVKTATAGGLTVGGKSYKVEILYRDSQSSSNRASDVTSDLILNENVNLVLGASTPDTTIPVADQCELNGVPCITTDTPWQPYFFGRHGDPKKGFEWTYHFFWGLEDIIGTYTSMWSQAPTNKVVGGLWPNDSDGNAWASPKIGFPPVLAAQNFKLVDLGRFPLPNDNFSSFIDGFKKNNVEIVTGVLPPPDFANFWNEAGQQGLRPKIVTAAKATEFPAAIEAFGARADGLSVEVWWSPAYPFSSSLTGQSSAQLAAAFTAATGLAWTMPLGFRHALFEVAIDVLKRSASTDPAAIRAAIAATSLNTITGPINFAKGPVPNIAKTPLTGGQWRKGANGFDLVLVDNSQAPMVPVHDKLQLLS